MLIRSILTTSGMSSNDTEVREEVKMEICSANCTSVKRRFSNAERTEGHREESD